MTDPVPVSLGLKALDRLLEIEQDASPGPWHWTKFADTSDDGLCYSDPDLICAACAALKPLVEYLRDDIRGMEGPLLLPHHRDAIAPIIDHLDATDAGWRER